VAADQGVVWMVNELCECGERALKGSIYCPSCEADIWDAVMSPGVRRRTIFAFEIGRYLV
jgi:hypothetical protein